MSVRDSVLLSLLLQHLLSITLQPWWHSTLKAVQNLCQLLLQLYPLLAVPQAVGTEEEQLVGALRFYFSTALVDCYLKLIMRQQAE